MINRKARVILSVLITSILLVSSATVALANVESQTKYYGPVGGYSYSNCATADVCGLNVSASVNVSVRGASQVPAGYMGCMPGLYNSSGTLLIQGEWVYNSVAAGSMCTNTRLINPATGAYYSRGITAAFNGDGYDCYESYRTPNINYTHSDRDGEDGQTFSSSLNSDSIESEPDLIKAMGIDGMEGYVLSKDLIGDMPKNPEEALALQKKNEAQGGRDILLYAADGKKVIGKFHIGIADLDNNLNKN